MLSCLQTVNDYNKLGAPFQKFIYLKVILRVVLAGDPVYYAI